MKLSEVKNSLNEVNQVQFQLPNGSFVPHHFHVTEIGVIQKSFIDCGGTIRNEKVINFQLWEATDFDHRLAPQKLKNIISLSEKVLQLEDLEVEVEYQADTIGKYNLRFENGNFILINKKTDCLAKDNCGVPQEKPRIKMADLGNSCCTPNSGCC